MKSCVLAGPYAGVEAIYMDLARQLDLPDHFGANLDALWDALTRNVEGPVEISWPEFSRHRRRLGIAADRLRSIVDRIERLEEERKALGNDIKDIYAEAKSAGFDVKVLRQLIRIRKQEAAEVEERVNSIDRDRDELTTAIAKLRGSIGHINREGREKLNAVFQQVDRHFQALFTRMFGGGRAHLALVGSDDPLEAGLEIFAKPPGKKPATLSLLSGGEQALTAMALIFAVFLTNPAPICVLDEVDAPLDDHNVERFCDLLHEMTKTTETRFIIITHNPITMARMNRLFGVTMAERGVSQLVSVDLRQAEAMAARYVALPYVDAERVRDVALTAMSQRAALSQRAASPAGDR